MNTHSFTSQPGAPASRDGHAATTLRIAAPPPPALVDDPRGVVITGCEPHSPVVVHARVEIDSATREAMAAFRADEAGTVDTGRDASLAGTYRSGSLRVVVVRESRRRFSRPHTVTGQRQAARRSGPAGR